MMTPNVFQKSLIDRYKHRPRQLHAYLSLLLHMWLTTNSPMQKKCACNMHVTGNYMHVWTNMHVTRMAFKGCQNMHVGTRYSPIGWWHFLNMHVHACSWDTCTNLRIMWCIHNKLWWLFCYTTVHLALFSLKLGSSAAYFSPVSITTHLLRIKVVG